MKVLKNEKGVALVTSLMLTLISLGMVMALLQLVLMQTKISGAHKRYKNSLEAAHGGVQLIAKEIIPMLFSDTPDPKTTLTSEFAAIELDTSSNECLKQKLTSPTGNWTACGAGSTSMDPKTGWDMTFKLPGVSGSGYQVYAKIVDSKPGNSDMSGVLNLDSGAGVTGSSPAVDPMHQPAIYRIETEGESTSNSKEKAELTVFYSY
jgi:Tfp pilus assembly protein PilX